MTQPGFDPYSQPNQPNQPAQQNDPRAYGRTGRSSGGMFPFPHRNFQMRRGTNVTVGGCCLPLPIGCLATTAMAALSAAKVVRSLR